MIATLSILALVGLGFAHIDPVVLLPIAGLNALIGLQHAPSGRGTADAAVTGSEPCFLAAFNRALPMQILYAAIGYGLGLGASLVL